MNLFKKKKPKQKCEVCGALRTRLRDFNGFILPKQYVIGRRVCRRCYDLIICKGQAFWVLTYDMMKLEFQKVSKEIIKEAFFELFAERREPSDTTLN